MSKRGGSSAGKKRARADSDEEDTDQGLLNVQLSAKRRLKVYEYSGILLCDIRETWTDAAGQVKPTRKGISLTLEQMTVLADHLPQIMAKMREASGEKKSKKEKSKKDKSKAASSSSSAAAAAASDDEDKEEEDTEVDESSGDTSFADD